MFKLPVIIAFVACCSAVNASPSTSDRGRAPSREDSVRPTTPAPTDCGHDSGYKYSNETGSCYKWHGKEVSWTQANDTCVAEKAHLAVINGRGEARLLGDMVRESKWYDAFVGYHRDDAGEWRAVTGETPEAAAGYSPWGVSWPYSDEQRRYPAIWRDGTLYNVANNYPCPFVCEKRPQ